jgi:nucleoredoxin
MKTTFTLLGILMLTLPASAEFRTWTRNDGKTADLELVSVTGTGSDMSAEFRMRDGRTVTIKAATLVKADADLLAAWKPHETEPSAAPDAPASIFDEILDGNLVKLSGKSLKPARDVAKPEKFYVFYYTASWCGPCQQYTPSLVEFYEKHKNAGFEIFLITSDQDENAMEQYAAEKKMPWPQLKFRKTADFKKKFEHGVTGIPAVIVCKPDGTKIDGQFRNLAALEQLVK